MAASSRLSVTEMGMRAKTSISTEESIVATKEPTMNLSPKARQARMNSGMFITMLMTPTGISVR